MGDFSRDTFNKLKHYVSVRLQQGVPIVDADWNEAFDVRKFELQAFLKWFVGDGVPKGNDGFCIAPAPLIAPKPVEPVPVIKPASGLPVPVPLAKNDFIIKAGRCLVEGWDVINDEEGLRYTGQFLYDNDEKAKERGMPPLEKLKPPQQKGTTRTDLVYLDVWEREVDSTDDFDNEFPPSMVNEAIGIETCVRLKREWVVRVDEGITDDGADDVKRWAPPDDIVQPDHVYYPLALLSRKGGEEVIRKDDITDLRLTGLSMTSTHDIQQIVTDAYGPTYTLDHDGQPNLKVSLREAINAILRGELPSTPELLLTTDVAEDDASICLEDSNGDIWVFWQSDRSGNKDIWYNRYNHASGKWEWEDDAQLTTDEHKDEAPFALEDSNGDIWVFWQSDRSGDKDIWYNRYNRASGKWEWEDDAQLTTDEHKDVAPFALEDSNGDIWVFWQSDRAREWLIFYNIYHPADDRWEGDTLVPPRLGKPSSLYKPSALEDSNGDIWLFYLTDYEKSIRYQRYNRALPEPEWGGSKSLETDIPDLSLEDHEPFALKDSNGVIWVFWHLSGNIWCSRCTSPPLFQDKEPLTTVSASDCEPFALEDSSGDIWVFWQSDRSGNKDIWFKRYNRACERWEDDAQLTTDDAVDKAPFALEDNSGDIWVFWKSARSESEKWDIWYRKLVSAI